MTALVPLLIAILIVAFIIWLIRQIPLPAPWGNVAIGIVALVCLIWLLQDLPGLLGTFRHG